MTLDSWLVGRLSRELDAALAGARVDELSADARGMSIGCYRRGVRTVLLASFDPERPIAAVVPDGVIPNESGPGGWATGVAPLLRGSIIDTVQAVPHDRILSVDVSSRSAFGVPARHRITLELEPRKVNALVLRPGGSQEWTILAAAKQIDGREGAREVAVGRAYSAPPARTHKLDRAAFFETLRAATSECAPQQPAARTVVRLLGELDPTCTPPLARDIVERVLAHSEDRSSDEIAALLLSEWSALRPRVKANASDLAAPIFCYARGDEITACHLVPLSWPPGEVRMLSGLNDACAEELSRATRKTAPEGAALRRKVERMLSRGAEQIAELAAAQQRAHAAEQWRVAGDAIYANLAAIVPRSSFFETPEGTRVALDPKLSAKQNAAAYFRRYKKARSGTPQIEARLQTLALNRRYWEELLWELDRADAQPALRAEIYADVSAAISPPKRAALAKRRKGTSRAKPAAVELVDGALAYVGRSPKDNDRLTFAFANPDDYWFHARGIPGAHVILRLPRAGATPSAQQINAAAALAAGASRAADALKVEVDYTQRKHVRRQSKGRAGLVWYTDFKTVIVAPRG